MSQVAPSGPVYQAGTLSGNPLAMAAGIATLKQIGKPGFYEQLDGMAQRLSHGLTAAAAQAGITLTATRVGSMMGLFFAEGPVRNYADAKRSDLDRFAAYYQGMLSRGIYLAPSQFEASFVSAAHDQAAIDETIAAAAEVFASL
jgi:glutamate-1-semialdehyde 2,1-aminomutase